MDVLINSALSEPVMLSNRETSSSVPARTGCGVAFSSELTENYLHLSHVYLLLRREKLMLLIEVMACSPYIAVTFLSSCTQPI